MVGNYNWRESTMEEKLALDSEGKCVICAFPIRDKDKINPTISIHKFCYHKEVKPILDRIPIVNRVGFLNSEEDE